MKSQLPPLVVTIIALVITGLLVFNVIADSRSPEYDGQPMSMLLAAIIAGLLNVARSKWFGGDEK